MRIQYINNGFFIKDGEKMLAANFLDGKSSEEIKAIAERTLADCIAAENAAAEKSLEEYKADKIAESKARLSEWFENNPYLHTDGNYYSVTEEKQSLLNSNLASYERATQAGIPYPLKWNSTGAECTEWSYEDLMVLSLSIAAYVAPKVSIQQAAEVRIRSCTTKAEVDGVAVDYEAGN